MIVKAASWANPKGREMDKTSKEARLLPYRKMISQEPQDKG